jgi:hypothetical protein
MICELEVSGAFIVPFETFPPLISSIIIVKPLDASFIETRGMIQLIKPFAHS